jgi:hypothetical protein
MNNYFMQSFVIGHKKNILVVLLLPAMIFTTTAQDVTETKVSSIPYNWKNIQIVGGGFVDGIVFHPLERNLCYCRTDMGGAYHRNPETLLWEPLLDWLPYEDLNLMGVESIALDPSDPDRLYLACGTYTNPQTPNGAILRSDDRGETFQRTDLPFKMGANENGRGNGERMAVDPANGNIIYLGTRHDGLWKSTDRGINWNRVLSFPDISETPPAGMQNEDSIRRWKWFNQGSGIVFVVFDPATGKAGKSCSTLYAGASIMGRDNLFFSDNAGLTWQPVKGQPVQYRPTHSVLAKDGTIYITYGTSPGPSRMTDGGIWKYNTVSGEWTEITPDLPDPEKRKAFGYAAVAVDAHNPQNVIASTFGRPDSAGRDDIFRSTNGGRTLTAIFGRGGTFDFSGAPYVARTPIHWLFDIEIDPADPNHAIFTTGYGGYETFNLTNADSGKPTKWSVMSRGIEETVALDLLSPPNGAPLISAIGDYGGFVHWDPDNPSPEGGFDNPRFGNTTGLALAWNDPGLIVRVGRATNHNPGQHIGYSTDSGRTWRPAVSSPCKECRLGSVAVSSDGHVWIWSPDPIRNFPYNRIPVPVPVYFTKDRGATWLPCKGLPDNSRVVADPVNPAKFYAMDLFGGKLFISNDKGVSFAERNLNLPGSLPEQREKRGDVRGGQDRIYASPGMEGDLWIAAYDGLYHSADTGLTFTEFPDVLEIHAFGFGMAAPGNRYPALYLIGSIVGIRGIFRSDDQARSWVRINDARHQWGLLLQVTGDPKKYGRVYVGTHGRGIILGDPAR